jgi:Fic family protein
MKCRQTQRKITMHNEPQYYYRWKPIEDISENQVALESSELKTLASIWQEHATELATSQTLKRFNERLARQWAIETGIIEGIYKIDRGITELLIEKGIETALIPHGTTDKPAEHIVAILKDHQNVLEGLFDFVSSKRPLSTSYIKEVHQALCRHQNEVDAKDTQGRFFQVPLKKREWKQQPNNPHRADGLIHEYCPPEHVAAEMDRLIEMHLQHIKNEIPPEVEAAWLHHRFSQIHPFQDGNGRVARALATLVLLRAQLFPFTVDDSERDNYISNLESADNGDLAPFTQMIAQSQRSALVSALSLSERLLTEEKDISALIQAGAQSLKEKKEIKSQNLKEVYNISAKLEDFAFKQMEKIGLQIRESLRSVDSSYDCMVIRSEADKNEYWFSFQVAEVAKQIDYYADLRRYHHWIRLRIAESQFSSIVVSFHPLGMVFRGVMAVSAFYEQRPRDEEESHTEVPLSRPVISDIFEFTYNQQAKEIMPRFEKWLHETLLVSLTEWRKSM